MNGLHSVHRYKHMLQQLLAAYETKEEISWDLTNHKYSSHYVAKQLHNTLHFYISDPANEIAGVPFQLAREVAENWKIRALDKTTVNASPRRKGYKLITTMSKLETREALFYTDNRININAANPELAHAACLLKNHDQLTQTICLLNLDPSLAPSLLATYPNIELIRDTVAGVETSNFILL